MNNQRNHCKLKLFKLLKLFELSCSIDPSNVQPILGSFWQPEVSKKGQFWPLTTSDLLLGKCFLSSKVHKQAITIFVGFTLVKIDSFELLK
jgi:hypothetical protein